MEYLPSFIYDSSAKTAAESLRIAQGYHSLHESWSERLWECSIVMMASEWTHQDELLKTGKGQRTFHIQWMVKLLDSICVFSYYVITIHYVPKILLGIYKKSMWMCGKFTVSKCLPQIIYPEIQVEIKKDC